MRSPRELLSPLRRAGLLALLALLVALLSGCATVPEGAASLRSGTALKPQLQWPPAPQAAAVVWVKEIRTPKDVGVVKGFWSRVAEFFVGERAERIRNPYGVFVDGHDRLFVADVKLGLVHLMDVKGREYREIGGKGVFKTPIGVTEDDQENLYITDSSAGTVFKYHLPDGTLTRLSSFKITRPTGIAYSRVKKLLYVADTVAHQVKAVGLDGVEKFRIGKRGLGPGEFNFPTDLFVDSRGLLYVTDSLNSRIEIFSPEGVFLKAFGQAGDAAGSLARPKGVAVDSGGHVYICDALQDSVQIFNQAGKLLLAIGEKGSEPGEFWMPSGIYIDGEDYIYVSDTYNSRIQVLKYLRRHNEGAADGKTELSPKEKQASVDKPEK